MDSTDTQKTTQTRLAAEHGPTGNVQHSGPEARTTGAGMVCLLAGGLGAVAGIIPGLGVVAIILALVALVTGVPAIRAGTGDDGRRFARYGVVLGLAALGLGLVNIGIQAELFTYFTAE